MAESPLLLTVQTPEGAAFDRTIVDSPVVIGRSSKAGLPIADLRLSREHARLTCDGDHWTVEDLGSHNGTYLNGTRVELATRLQPGDVLLLGASRLTVRAGSDQQTDNAPPEVIQTLFRPARDLLTDSRADAQGEALRRQADRLRLLNEVHQALSRPIALSELLELILDRAFAYLRPEEGAIYLRGAAGGLECAAKRSARGPGREPINSSHLEHEVVDKGMAALVLDVAADGRFASAASILGAGLQSLVAAPLLDPQGSIGMMVLGSTAAVRCFGEDDMETLVSLASVAAMRIRNLALAEESAERRRLEHEMGLARRIQERLLPTELPEAEGWQLHASNRASRHVSGDLYTALLRDDGRELAFTVTDVAGKGVAASLLAASLEALCAGPLEAGRPPDEIFTEVSDRLYRRTPPEKYATAFLGAVEVATGRLRFANAGHVPGLLVEADGGSRLLEATGTPLGLLPASSFTPAETAMARGDLLVVCTDGFTEAEGREEELYGLDRFIELCRREHELPLAELAAVLDREIDAFTGAAPLSDDRTLLLVRRLA
jgi:phosphoserine phosphatase RsbU/P